MHIALVSNLYPPDVLGGYELLAHDVASGLRALGHRVSVLTSGDGSTGNDVARVLTLSRPFGTSASTDRVRHVRAAVRNRLAVRNWMARSGTPDVVLGMSLRRLGLAPMRAFAAANVPRVFTVNDDWPVAFAEASGTSWRARARRVLDALTIGLPRWTSNDATRVIYLSEAIRRHVRDAGAALPLGRVRAQGVDTRRFAPRPFRAIGATPHLLFAGRLHPSKCPEAAIDTIAALRARGVTATLTIAGAAHDEAYGRALRARAEQSGIASSITWLGQVDRGDLPSVYRAADVFLFATVWEGEAQGLTYLEAMACGVPVVAHPMGGARELLEGRGVAQCITVCTGDAFADAIVAMQNDPDGMQRQVETATLLLTREASLDAYVATIDEELNAAGARRR